MSLRSPQIGRANAGLGLRLVACADRTNSLLQQRCCALGITLRDDEFTRYTVDGKRRESVADHAALVRDEFGLPNFAIDEALQQWLELRRLRGA